MKKKTPGKKSAKSKSTYTPHTPHKSNQDQDEKIPTLSQILGKKAFLSDADLEAFFDKEFSDGALSISAALDPLDEAQSLIYEAWNTQGPEKVKLARRALELSKDCVDAYILLAEMDAKSLQAALALFRQALEAAERTMPANLLKSEAGNFWGIMETRPYMRARFGVAVCLRDLGKISEALDHMRALLHLNPSDNQGVRYMLMEGLLESGADEEIGALLTRYKTDASAVFCYTQALWMFRRLGPVKSAGASLAKAVAANPHVPGFLLKRIKLPKQAPKTISPGSFEEAESYAMHGIAVWQKTIGAVEWLTANAPGDAKPK